MVPTGGGGGSGYRRAPRLKGIRIKGSSPYAERRDDPCRHEATGRHGLQPSNDEFARMQAISKLAFFCHDRAHV